jgi:hypothetical protein
MLSLMAGLLGMLATGEPSKAARTVVVVFPIEDRSSHVSREGLETLNDYLAAQVGKVTGFSIVPRGEIRDRLSKEKAESYKACYDDACQIDLGKELAASNVVATRLRPLGSKCVLALYLYDLARSASDATATSRCECSEDGVVAAIDDVVRQLQGPAAEQKQTAAADANGRAPLKMARNVTPIWDCRGVHFKDVSEKERRTARLPPAAPNGVFVISVEAKSAAIEAGIQSGDIITEVGLPDGSNSFTRIRIDSPEELERLSTRRVDFLVKLYRGGDAQTVTLKANSGFVERDSRPQGARRAKEPIPAPSNGK